MLLPCKLLASPGWHLEAEAGLGERDHDGPQRSSLRSPLSCESPAKAPTNNTFFSFLALAVIVMSAGPGMGTVVRSRPRPRFCEPWSASLRHGAFYLRQRRGYSLACHRESIPKGTVIFGHLQGFATHLSRPGTRGLQMRAFAWRVRDLIMWEGTFCVARICISSLARMRCSSRPQLSSHQALSYCHC